MTRSRPAVSIQADSSLSYYGVFIEALSSFYGTGVRPLSRGFPELTDSRQGLSAVTPDGLNLFISANDYADDWNGDAMDWCHAYGKVNVNDASPPPGDSSKIVLLGPSVGVPARSARAALGAVARSALAGGSALREFPARARAYLRHTFGRVRLEDYPASRPEPGYLFLVATFWAQHPEANGARITFLRAVAERHRGAFEGGLVAQHPLPGSIADVPRVSALTHRDYLDAVARSVFAFSAPAVHGCLGWKLAEYFRMGKAIVSTPLDRLMPGWDTDRPPMYIVEESDVALGDAIVCLSSDPQFVEDLEARSLAYWHDYLEPKAQIGRLVAAARARA